MEQETQIQRGIRLAREGKMEEARAVFRDVIDDVPDDASVWCNYATTYLNEEDYVAALPYFEKAIELDPAFHGPYLSAGICLTALGFHEDALRLYDRALQVIPDNHEIWYNKAYTLMELGRVPEAIAGFDHVLKLHPLDAGAYINRRELLKSCTFKGQCVVYTCEEGQMNRVTAYVYSHEGLCFMTFVVDEVDDEDLVEYDPDEVEMYDGPDDDGEVEGIEKDDPRYETRSLVYFTPDGVMAHGQLEHSPEFPAYAENYEVGGYEVLCPDNIWCEVLCRSGHRYLLCQSIDFVYAHDPDTLEVLDVFRFGVKWDDPAYEDGWDDGDREDCQRAWRWLEGRLR
ncbi:tetratricopeptide repeat protein [Methanospirillum hungatei]|jgi:tetratricopeptide (TPR) repeat protein|uniref:tetratricopeptide repeat protein n=1 Tax=Methanospirillum hungatei TaxID=2203 RepID=UPI002CE98497|nr:tetratricopeptide repeat protein [Methanospirillum hungatei]HOW05831.1 tetratricopeptide repeat protein [Methanospirillum hungatei]